MKSLLRYNRHWEKGYRYPYPKKRQIFPKIKDCLLNRHQIIELVGLRRVGKSTLIFQLINHLKQKKVNTYHLLYFTFDETQPSIDEILVGYQQQTGIDYKKEKIYFFLDEIQKLANFQNQLKIYYDLYPNIKFVISGSTSLFVRKKTQESLAGRIIPFLIHPLLFNEYLYFIEKEAMLTKPRLYYQELETEFVRFLSCQFIETIGLKSIDEKEEYFRSIIKKIIFEDLPFVFNFNNPHLLYRIVQYLASYPGSVINNLHLAQELGISNKTAALYLSYLEDSFLIKKLYNFSLNITASERKLKKYYLASPSFTLALTDFVSIGNLVENYIASVYDVKYFYQDPYGHEVDFISVDNKKLTVVESKFKKKITDQDLNSIIIFNKKYPTKKNVVFGRKEGKKTIKMIDIEFAPFYSTKLF